jgi:hypothetical protein
MTNTLLKKVLRSYFHNKQQESVSPNESVTAELVFDEKRDRNLLVHAGW